MRQVCLISNAWSVPCHCLICIYGTSFCFCRFRNTAACAEWQTCSWAFTSSGTPFWIFCFYIARCYGCSGHQTENIYEKCWNSVALDSVNLFLLKSLENIFLFIIITNMRIVCAVHPSNWYLEYRLHICWSSHWNSVISWEECCAPTRFNNRSPWNAVIWILIPGMPTYVCMTFTIFLFESSTR